MSTIKFYERGQPYFEFTNFAEFPILLDGKTWPTSEHYFQAQKFVGTPYVEQIRNLPRPRDAFDLSRQPQVSQWLRSDWEQVKLHVMHKALQAKFSQHNHLRDMLVKTGDRQLIEHTTRDSFWGDGGDGRGQNHLGKLLMQVRSELSSLQCNNVTAQGVFGFADTLPFASTNKHHALPLTNCSKGSMSSRLLDTCDKKEFCNVLYHILHTCGARGNGCYVATITLMCCLVVLIIFVFFVNSFAIN